MKHLSDAEKWKLLFKADPHRAASDLTQQSPEQATDTAEALGAAYLVNVIEQLQSDTGADLLRHTPDSLRDRVLADLPAEKAEMIRDILSHPPGTAGSIMAKEFLSVPQHFDVGRVIDYLRRVPEDLKGKVSYIYAVDPVGRLEGVIQARDLIFHPTEKPVSEMIRKPVVQAETAMPQMDVAKLLQRHRYLGLPVVDSAQKLVGVVSADRAMQTVQEEATDDMAKMIGTSAEELRTDSVRRIIRLRLPWLSVNIIGGLLCAFIAGIFENDSISATTLFLFVPVVLGLSESMGVQSATIVVRNLTLGNPTFQGILPVLRREFTAGTFIGAVCGAVVGLCAWLWKRDATLGFALAGSLVPAIWVSAAIGLALPLIFRRLKTDPAIASGPLTLALCDVQTMTVYFFLAQTILRRSAA